MIAGRAATNPAQFALPDDNVTDGNGVQGTLTMGVSTEDGRGNITAYVSYSDTKQVLQRDRDFSACSLATGAPTTSFACGGSGTAVPGTFTNFLPAAQGGFNFTVDATSGNFRPFSNATDQYNFGPLNHYLRPDTRYSLGAMGHYELAEFADVYTQLMFTDVRSVAQIAPGGIFFDTSTINCDNPFLNATQAATDWLRCRRDCLGCQHRGCTSVVVTSKVADVSRTSTTPRSVHWAACAARLPRAGTMTWACSSRAPRQTPAR